MPKPLREILLWIDKTDADLRVLQGNFGWSAERRRKLEKRVRSDFVRIISPGTEDMRLRARELAKHFGWTAARIRRFERETLFNDRRLRSPETDRLKVEIREFARDFGWTERRTKNTENWILSNFDPVDFYTPKSVEPIRSHVAQEAPQVVPFLQRAESAFWGALPYLFMGGIALLSGLPAESQTASWGSFDEVRANSDTLPSSAPPPGESHSLYWIGTINYIGITNDPKRREREHRLGGNIRAGESMRLWHTRISLANARTLERNYIRESMLRGEPLRNNHHTRF